MNSQKISVSDSDAVFLGWQEMLSGKGIPLFNITKEGHPQYGSTVTEKVLHDLNLKIPKRSRYWSKRKNLDSQKKEDEVNRT